MRNTLSAMLLLLTALVLPAAVTVHPNATNFTVASSVTGDFDAFMFEWSAWDDQTITAGFDLAIDNMQFRISGTQDDTVYVDAASSTNYITSGTNIAYFAISRTNMQIGRASCRERVLS